MKVFKVSILAAFFVFCNANLWAQNYAFKNPFDYFIDDDLPAHMHESIGQFHKAAMTIISNNQPDRDNFFNWSNRKQLAKKNFQGIYYTTQESFDLFDQSTQQRVELIFQDRISNHIAIQAMTLSLENQRTNEVDMIILVFVENVFYDNDRQAYSESECIAHLTTSIAHEIFGHVDAFLAEDIDSYIAWDEEALAIDELSAMVEGILFYKRLEAGKLSQTSSQLQKAFLNAYEREKEMFYNHQTDESGVRCMKAECIREEYLIRIEKMNSNE